MCLGKISWWGGSLLPLSPPLWVFVLLGLTTTCLHLHWICSYSSLFPDWSGGRVQLRRGVHLWEAKADASQGGQRVDCWWAATLPGLHLPGWLVLEKKKRNSDRNHLLLALTCLPSLGVFYWWCRTLIGMRSVVKGFKCWKVWLRNSKCQLLLRLCFSGRLSFASCHRLLALQHTNRGYQRYKMIEPALTSSSALLRQSILCKWRFQEIYCICNIYFDDHSKCKLEILTMSRCDGKQSHN